jgi:hypothetical protein
MTVDEARSLICDSIQRGSKTPILGGKSRELYMQEETDALLSYVIEPISVTVTGQGFGDGLVDFLAKHPPIAIARAREHWLLYLPHSSVQAYGWDAHSLNVLGFHSTDALAEWLG